MLRSHQVVAAFEFAAASPPRNPFDATPLLRYLSLNQLRALGTRMPDLASRAPFVEALLSALAPAATVDMAANTAARDAYIAAVEAVLVPLPGAFNDYRLRVLYAKARCVVVSGCCLHSCGRL